MNFLNFLFYFAKQLHHSFPELAFGEPKRDSRPALQKYTPMMCCVSGSEQPSEGIHFVSFQSAPRLRVAFEYFGLRQFIAALISRHVSCRFCIFRVRHSPVLLDCTTSSHRICIAIRLVLLSNRDTYPYRPFTYFTPHFSKHRVIPDSPFCTEGIPAYFLPYVREHVKFWGCLNIISSNHFILDLNLRVKGSFYSHCMKC